MKKNSVLVAPMEGITDVPFRLALLKTYPEWDYIYTDFFRLPTVGCCQKRHIIDHIGKEIYSDPDLRSKTVLQILTTKNCQTALTSKLIENLEIGRLDLNLGCPSKRVNLHKGGAYLLGDLKVLKKIVQDIRENFSKTFSVKMRIGIHDDRNFVDTLKMLESEGVDMIAIHARTRDQHYSGVANWDYIKKACETVKIPIIGNGDVKTSDEIRQLLTYSGCHSVMIGRAAIGSPWLGDCYKSNKDNPITTDEKINCIRKWFRCLEEEYSKKKGLGSNAILGRFKAHYTYMDKQNHLKSPILQTRSFEEFWQHLY